MCFSVNQIDDLPSSNKQIVMDLPSSVNKVYWIQPRPITSCLL